MYTPYEKYDDGSKPENTQPLNTQASDAGQAESPAEPWQAEQSQPAPERTYTAAGPNPGDYPYNRVPNNVPYAAPEPPKKKKGGKKFLKLVAAACVFGILAGACFGGVNWAIGRFSKGDPAEVNAAEPTPSPVAQQDIPYTTVQTSAGTGTAILDVTSVVQNAMPAMVSINVVGTATVQNIYGGLFGYGNSYEYETKGSGSGIIIGKNDTELMMVTNNHVVGDAKEIAIEFIDGASAIAYIKGTNADFDLAVVAVPLKDLTDETLESIKIAVMGDSDSLELGEPAIAIGNALGYGQSVTVGYISALSGK